ncbi:MAG: fibro-slime domain-containing protein [Fibrobacterota bacterium]|nr:MAG: fibro-slime domain-containing protein [Fibrobacterota bacterium]
MSATTSPRRTRSVAGFVFLLLLGLTSAPAANPKTLMIMVDFWGQRSQMDTIINLRVFQPTEIKLVSGGVVPNPVLSNAYETEPFGWWYSLANFNPDDYVNGRVRFNTQYLRGWLQNDSTYSAKAGDTIFFPDTQTTFTYQNLRTGLTTPVVLPIAIPKFFVFPDTSRYRGPKLYTAASNSNTDLLNMRPLSMVGVTIPGAIDSCMALYLSDTLWIRWGTPTNPPGLSAYAKDMKCFDHNPFFPSRGKIEVFSPWAGAKSFAVVNGIPQLLRPGTRPGWLQGEAWTLPGDQTDPQVRFRFELSNGDIKIVDSTSKPYRLLPSATTNYIHPSMGTHPGFHQSQLGDSVVFAWASPWRSRISYLHFGGDERIQGIWQPQGWFAAKVWGRPTRAGLTSSDGDSSVALVDVSPGTPGTMDTIWLTAKPTTPAKIRLDGRAYDYKLGNTRLVIGGNAMSAPMDSSAYFPFSQCTNSDLIQGLVNKRLGKNGKPQWTGKSICGLSSSSLPTFGIDSSECTNPANAMEHWFDPVSQGGKAMNATFPISLELSTLKQGALTYEDSLYFPLDSFLTLPGGSQPNPFRDSVFDRLRNQKHNYGYCLEFHGEAQIQPGARISVTSDDDTWIFVDSNLVVDLGGQHELMTLAADLDRLPIFPLPPLVPVDIFHCERHVDESGLFLSMNFPVYPVGAMKVPPRVSPLRSKTVVRTPISLQARNKALSVNAPAGQAWSLELRGMDGRLKRSVSGTGATLVPWSNSGITIALLKSGHEAVTGRFITTR